jgi:hypothetical protein
MVIVETFFRLLDDPVASLLLVGSVFLLLITMFPKMESLYEISSLGRLLAGFFGAFFFVILLVLGFSEMDQIEAGDSQFKPSQVQAVKLFVTTDDLHLGDEVIQDWPPLQGECTSFVFSVPNSVRNTSYVEVRVDIFGVQNGTIALNDKQFNIPQNTRNEIYRRGNHWEVGKVVYFPSDVLQPGENVLELCAGIEEEQARSPVDKDDFRVRNIEVVAALME